MRLVLLFVGLLLAGAAPLAGQAGVRVGDVQLQLGGRLHIQYEQGSVADLDPSGVFARRARLRAEVRWGEYLEAHLQPEFAGGPPELEDAWIALRLGSALRFSMGQFNRTLEIFELTSSNDLPIIERDARVGGGPTCVGVDGVCSLSNLLAGLSFVGRDQGLRLEWTPGERWAIASTLTNGTGANQSDENRAKSLSVRVAFTPQKGVAIALFRGVHDYLVDAEGPRPDTRFATVTGMDVSIGGWRDGPRFQGAVAWGDNWKAGRDVRFGGVHLLGSWYLPLQADGPLVGLEPMLRFGWADGARGSPGAGQGFVMTPGVAAYVHGRNRIALNVDFADPAATAARWSLKVQTYTVF